MLKYTSSWSRSHLELVSRAWFRLHYLCVTADIDPAQWYTGPVVSVLLKCATRGGTRKSQNKEASTRRNNGSTVERDTRDGLYFLMRNCCLQIPGIVAPAVKQQHWSSASLRILASLCQF